ncbi:tRNA (adenosine(37)-N6)-threonylcarbamoyltransferase complex ATPase subunit type 1 TsaE [Ignavibacteriales bacterium]
MTGVRIILSEDEMREFARELHHQIKPGNVIALNGELGAGKTLLVKAFCSAAGFAGSSSPTFAIVNSYPGEYTIYHFDFYRIKKAEELMDIGIEEYLADEKAVSFIEWAELFPDVLPETRLEITIKVTGETSREITIEQK